MAFRLRLCFGSSSSPHIWELAIECFLALLGAHSCDCPALAFFWHWVDDLLKVCRSWEEAVRAVKLVILVALLYGFELAPDKVGLSQQEEFTGILFDAASLCLSVRPKKRMKCLALLELLAAAPARSKQDFRKLC